MSVFTAVRLLPSEPSADDWRIIDDKTIGNKGEEQVFDFAFLRHRNEEVYDRACRKMVRSVLDGFNSTIAAYGQSGAGKTHSLLGSDLEDGLLQLAVFDLLSLISERPTVQYMVKFMAYEVYNETFNDLLSDSTTKCRIVNDKVIGATEEIVESYDHFVQICQQAQGRRKVGETALNKKSSRSHAIFQLIIESCSIKDEKQVTIVSKLLFLDLAGSENSRTMVNNTQTVESKNINLSLLALSCVISAFAENPPRRVCSFRDSILTRILKPVLGGNSKFFLLCCIRKAACTETSSTLVFAQKAKKMPNHSQKNVETEDASLPNLVAQIDALKKQLKEKETAEQERSKDHLEELLRKVFNANPTAGGVKTDAPKRRHSIAFGGGSTIDFSAERHRPRSTTPQILAQIDETDSGRSSRMSIEEGPLSSVSEHSSVGTQTEVDEEKILLKERLAVVETSLAAETEKRRKLEEEVAELREKLAVLSAQKEEDAKLVEEAKALAEAEKSEEARKTETEMKALKEKVDLYLWKYSDLKKRGQVLLNEKDAKIAANQQETEKWMKVSEKEKEARKKAFKELEAANQLVKDQLKEEKRLRLEKGTECEALQEKLAEMSVPARGLCLVPTCTNQEHRYLLNKIKVLIRQREIITASLNERLENE